MKRGKTKKYAIRTAYVLDIYYAFPTDKRLRYNGTKLNNKLLKNKLPKTNIIVTYFYEISLLIVMKIH